MDIPELYCIFRPTLSVRLLPRLCFHMLIQGDFLSQTASPAMRGSYWRWALCAAVAITTFAAVAPRAQASCGYYVISANPSAEMAVSQQGMKHVRSKSEHCPCHGTECRSGKSQGAIPAVTQVTSTDEMASPAIAGTGALESSGRSYVHVSSSLSEAFLHLADPPPRPLSLLC